MSADEAPRQEPATAAGAAPVGDVDAAWDDMGGDAACWLGRVCDNCGALIEGSRGVPCWRCNTPWEPL